MWNTAVTSIRKERFTVLWEPIMVGFAQWSVLVPFGSACSHVLFGKLCVFKAEITVYVQWMPDLCLMHEMHTLSIFISLPKGWESKRAWKIQKLRTKRKRLCFLEAHEWGGSGVVTWVHILGPPTSYQLSDFTWLTWIFFFICEMRLEQYLHHRVWRLNENLCNILSVTTGPS